MVGVLSVFMEHMYALNVSASDRNDTLYVFCVLQIF